MSTYTTSITPRLRVARNSSFNTYDRSVSQIATATEGGPSRLPEFSQLVDVDLDDISFSEQDGRPSTSTTPPPAIPNRSETPAATLRSLISRLSTGSRTISPRPRDSQDYLSERESDYDMDLTESANVAHSMVQENVRDIFSKARRDPGDTPQKTRLKLANGNTEDTGASSFVNYEQKKSNGRRRSLSNDDLEHPHSESLVRPVIHLIYSICHRKLAQTSYSFQALSTASHGRLFAGAF